MNQGKHLTALGDELQRQLESRRDFVAPSNALTVDLDGPENGRFPVLAGLNGSNFQLNPWAHQQLGQYLQIPKPYYDRCLEQDPELLAINANRWLQKNGKEARLIRTLGGKVRAVLSSRFRALDNYDLYQVAQPTIQAAGCEIVSAEVTERKLYIKAISPLLRAELQGTRTKGDIVEGGICISNSEVGAGVLSIQGWARRLVCLNGLTVGVSFRKYHLGRRIEDEEVRELLTDEGKTADDAALWYKVRDLIAKGFDPEFFQGVIAGLNESVEQKIEGSVEKVIEVTQKRFGLPEGLKQKLLGNLVKEGELNKFGLIQAVTAAANDEEDYETSHDLEVAGGKILELKPTEWSTILKEAA